MIELVGVSKRFPGRERPVLSEIDLEVPPGQFLFLTGPSGAGKTTLLRMLFGAELPSGGSIKVGGADLGRLSPRRMPLLRRKIGVIFQDFKLIGRLSVFENVALALRVAGLAGPRLIARVEEMLDQVGLADSALAPAESLSGGEQQRVAIARALVGSPPLVLADEPTGNLDPATALDVMRLLVQAPGRGATVLVATHDPRLVGLVKGARLVSLHGGHLREGC